jgi:hypothetical protein
MGESMKLFWLLPLAGLLATCGRTPLDPTGPIPAGGISGGSDANPVNPTQTGGSPAVGDASGGTCYATCSTPPGPIQVWPSNADLLAGLLGVWRICSGGPAIFTGAPSDTIGVEFAPPTPDGGPDIEGDMYFLRRAPSGPVRGPGSDYQQTYLLDDGVLYCHSIPKKIGYGLSLKYSPCPREWWFASEDWNHTGTLASF